MRARRCYSQVPDIMKNVAWVSVMARSVSPLSHTFVISPRWSTSPTSVAFILRRTSAKFSCPDTHDVWLTARVINLFECHRTSIIKPLCFSDTQRKLSIVCLCFSRLLIRRARTRRGRCGLWFQLRYIHNGKRNNEYANRNEDGVEAFG